MKKLLILMLAALLIMNLAACSEVTAPDAGGNEPLPSNDNPNPDSGQPNTDTEDPQNTDSDAAITEQVLIDQKGIVVKALRLEDSWLGPELQVYIENNSEQGITVQARNTSVNGYMMEPTFSCDVAAGKKATDGLTFSSSDFEAHGIDLITDIELNFHVFDANTWDTIFDSEIITIETSAADSYSQTYDSSGEILFQGAGLSIVFQGITEDWLGPYVNLYIENNSEEAVTIQARDTSVNGFMIEPTFSCDIMPGKKALDGLSFFQEDVDANGIEAITELELYFHIFEADSWDTILDTDLITITSK